jgi:hypothetical protein
MSAYAPPPAPPPAICRSAAFVDVVGTPGADRLAAFSRATRVWGLGGADRLTGSPARASCLLGGRGNDLLFLDGGGGVAYGNRGRDFVFGSDLGDVIDGGRDQDEVAAGNGDDKVGSRDGRAEVVDCGPGADIVKADRADVLIGCESTNLAGKPLPHVKVRPRRVGPSGSVRFKLPATAAYRVLYIDSCRIPGEVVAQTHRRVVRLRRPALGWCPGRARLAVVRDPGYSLPPVPVARLAFTVR